MGDCYGVLPADADASVIGDDACLDRGQAVAASIASDYVILVHMYHSTSKPPEMQVLVASGPELERKPLEEWESSVRRGTDRMRQRLAFMTAEHHAVRNFAVSGLIRFQRALPLKEIADHLRFPEPRVQEIVEDLERRLFFLVRHADGQVAWAFPVTVENTPHAIGLRTGEQLFGACAEDAFATAFVVGRLGRRRLRVQIRSVCGQSGRPLRLTVASDLSWRSKTQGAEPMLFVPSLNWEAFPGPNIINDY